MYKKKKGAGKRVHPALPGHHPAPLTSCRLHSCNTGLQSNGNPKVIKQNWETTAGGKEIIQNRLYWKRRITRSRQTLVILNKSFYAGGPLPHFVTRTDGSQDRSVKIWNGFDKKEKDHQELQHPWWSFFVKLFRWIHFARNIQPLSYTTKIIESN